MKKVFKELIKYVVISFVLSSIIIIYGIVSMARRNTLPTVDLFYIGNAILDTIMVTLCFAPGIALIDWMVKSAKSLYKDYKESDRRGKIIIIVVFISILLRKILIWTS